MNHTCLNTSRRKKKERFWTMMEKMSIFALDNSNRLVI